jgi:hypothetical protein
MLEITFWAQSRAHAVAFLKAVNIADTDADGNLIPIAEVQIHPSRPNETIAIEGVEGWHGNMRFYGASEATLRKPEPEGGWQPEHDIFDRTWINELVAGRTGLIPEWQASADDPIPPWYEAGQCRAFDPALISSRSNVWA